MIAVSDIAADAKRILANCDDATLFSRLTHVVELLANESDWDPLIGVVDITTNPGETCITLPREVETPLSVNIGGTPAAPRNRFFSFHLNGPGDDCREKASYYWDDKGDGPLIYDPVQPVRFIAFLEHPDDNNAELWVYGYDENNRWIRTEVCGKMVDGCPVPTAYGYAVPNPEQQVFSRIVRVRKSATKGYIRLTSFEIGVDSGVLLGDYAPTETEPSYRRIKLTRNCGWVRVIFRRRVFKITSMDDLIPLHSPFAVLMALKATQKMEDDQLDEGEKYLARAIDFITKEQLSRNPVFTPEVQVRGPNIAAPHNRLE